MNPFSLKRARWSPYLVGASLGVLSWITFAAMDEALGTSTTVVRTVGVVERAVAPEHADANAYLGRYVGTTEAPKPWFDWQFALVLMMPVGAWISSRLSRSQTREAVPDLWTSRFGPGRARRWGAAFVGGTVMLFGARMAGGCTSGHSLSGGLQLAVGSWVFTGALFVAGIATAYALYGREGASRV